MPLLEDLLLRFRRVWAPPGAVIGQAGVPADLGARIDDELQQLSAHLASFEAEGDAIVTDAQRQADAIIAAARDAADRAVANARARLPEVRAASALARAGRRESEVDALMAAAAKSAAELRDTARVRMPPLVEAAVEGAFAGLSRRSKENHARAVGGR